MPPENSPAGRASTPLPPVPTPRPKPALPWPRPLLPPPGWAPSLTPSPTMATRRPAFAQCADCRHFLFRLQFGANIVQPQFSLQMFRRDLTVPRQNHHAQARAAQLLHHRPRLRPDVIAQNNACPSRSPSASQTSPKPASAARAGSTILSGVCSAIHSRRPRK